MMNRIQHNGEVSRRARYESLGQGADANVITAFEHQRLTVRDFSYDILMFNFGTKAYVIFKNIKSSKIKTGFLEQSNHFS